MITGFDKAWERVAIHSQQTAEQMHTIFEQAKKTQRLGGHVADVGCWRGACGRMVLMADRGSRPVHFFDTFCGIPEYLATPSFDYRKAGEHTGCQSGFIEQQIRFDQEESGYLRSDVSVHPGIFPASAVGIDPDIRYSLVVIDLELWRSTYQALMYFYPRMVKGGIISLQNFCASGCAGVLEAYNCFLVDYHLAGIVNITPNDKFQGEIVVNEPDAGHVTDRETEVATVEFEDVDSDKAADIEPSVTEGQDEDGNDQVVVEGDIHEKVKIGTITGKPGDGEEFTAKEIDGIIGVDPAEPGGDYTVKTTHRGDLIIDMERVEPTKAPPKPRGRPPKSTAKTPPKPTGRAPRTAATRSR